MTVATEIFGRRLRLPAPLTTEIEVERDLPMEAGDGAVLLADRYAARGAGPQPTVLVRSPYGRRGVFGLLYGRLLAERGLQVVIQSVRGTFGSGGEFSPFDERDDGLATLAWIRGQSWHRGGIGMTGPSYLGLVQWAVAPEAGDDLLAITPSVTASQFHGQAYGGGSLSLESAASWLVLVAAQERRLAPVHMLRALRRLPGQLDELPLGDLDERASGMPVRWYREALAHSRREDAYWVARDFSAGVGKVRAAAQLVGGWHDIFLPWMIDDFVALRQAGHAPQLIIGPWTHTSPGLTALSLREATAWLRAHLLGDRRLLHGAPVRVFVTGPAGGWRDLDDWPPPGARAQRLHLRPGGRLEAEAPADAGPPSRYRYDPADPTPALGGPILLSRTPVVDNRPLEARADVLTFTTAPLAEPLTVVGPVSVTLHARSSLEHFDLFARVCDVEPGGASWNVCDALVRVGPGEPEPDAGGVRRVAFDLWPAAHRFAPGRRVRLQVSSGAHPRYARNTGTGEPLAEARRLVAADQELFHSAERPSALILSVVP